jgi:hypothetical protein
MYGRQAFYFKELLNLRRDIYVNVTSIVAAGRIRRPVIFRREFVFLLADK